MDNHQNFSPVVKRIFFRVLLFVVLLFVLGFAVLLLWNFVLTPVTNFATINYWQALGLLILFRVLLGNFYFGVLKSLRMMGAGGQQHSFKNKLLNMDEADRVAFKEEWRKRCENRKR